MKKFAKIAVLCLSAVALMGMSGCNNDNKDPDDPIVEKEVKVIGLELAESITVDCGATQKLEAKVLPENATNKAVTWSSDNPNIATVSDDGTVTGVANGSTVVKCTTVDGGYVRECAVTVRGYKLSNKVFENFGLVVTNESYNASQESGDTTEYKDYKVDDSNEDYLQFSFNRKETKDWSSVICWYDQKDTYSSLEVEVELVEGSVPAIMVEFGGETHFKQFKRINLEKGKVSKLSMNISDYNIKTGEQGDGSYGFIYLELNNPNDKSDATRRTDENVVIRIRKMALVEGTKTAPEKINGLRFDTILNKLVFEKDVAATNYGLEVYKIEGETETLLDLDVRMTRFAVAGEKIPNMEVAFTPKKTAEVNENFAEVPGSYKARVKGINSVGEGEWCDFVNFVIEDKGESTTGYKHTNILNNGEITVNEYNKGANKDTYKAELTDEGYKLSFTGATTENEWQIWDAFVAKYDTTKVYEKLIVKFKVLKSANPIQKVVVELAAGESDPKNNIWTMNDVSPDEESNVAIAIDITKSVSTFNGSIILGFDHTVGLGETEILLTNLELIEKEGSASTSAYVHDGLANDGAITVNGYNGGANKDTYKAELTDEGYKLSFTGATTKDEWQIWDSFVTNFDKTSTGTTLTLKYKVLKSDNPLNKIIIELGSDDASAKIQQWKTVSDDLDTETNIVTHVVAVPEDKSAFWGTISLQFDHTVGLGQTEILVTELSIK
ncbi:MAG: Ig-like domain-containing protein [Candidatus Onthovivens sp.]|nr:Ig-like domain-containing protein [Candidatus Onthovivens sp.]